MKLLAALLVAGLASSQDAPTIWIFFSPDSPDASRIFEQVKGEKVRAVLLVERYFGDREPSEAFLATVQAAGDVRPFDEDGLRMARKLGIRRLPAVAVVRGDRVHVATGTKVDVKELMKCAR
ncbi:MAG TPA: hypothetical protein VE981_07990 [Planctomycetota bacterium]|nr:hypothetical protein [Planctomycetota bacterium]